MDGEQANDTYTGLSFSLRKRGSIFLSALVCVCVCVSVCYHDTKKIVDGFVPNCMGRFSWEREDQVRVSLRSAEPQRDVEVTVKKLCQPAIVYIFRIAVCSSLIVGVALPRVGDKNPQISRGVVLSQSTFHLVSR